jgi:hypothetical protein
MCCKVPAGVGGFGGFGARENSRGGCVCVCSTYGCRAGVLCCGRTHSAFAPLELSPTGQSFRLPSVNERPKGERRGFQVKVIRAPQSS